MRWLLMLLVMIAVPELLAAAEGDGTDQVPIQPDTAADQVIKGPVWANEQALWQALERDWPSDQQPSTMVWPLLTGLASGAALIMFMLYRRQRRWLTDCRGTAAPMASEATPVDRVSAARICQTIRGPLEEVVDMTQLAMDARSGSRVTGPMASAHASAEHVLGLVNGLLDWSRIESGELTLSSVDFSPAEVVQKIAAQWRPRADEKQLSVSLNLSADLPPRLRGDASRFGEVISQLLGNAIRFSERGGWIGVTLALHASEGRERELKLTIEDTGTGISEERQQSLFIPFARSGRPTASRDGGVGLGLAISQQLARLMGGDISCESTPGVGSVFRFVARFELGREVTAGRVEVPRRDSVIIKAVPR